MNTLNMLLWDPLMTTEMETSSSTTSMTGSGHISPLEELPLDQLTTKVAAASFYVGTFFSSSSPQEKEEVEKEGEEKKSGEGGEGGMMAGTLGMMSSVFGFSQTPPVEDDDKETDIKEQEKDIKELEQEWGYFSPSSLSLGLSSLTMDNLYSAVGVTTAKEEKEEEAGEGKEEEKEDGNEQDWVDSFSNALTKVGQMTSDYSKVFQDSVYSAPMLYEFNQEQEEFIKNKEIQEQETGTALWSGLQIW